MVSGRLNHISRYLKDYDSYLYIKKYYYSYDNLPCFCYDNAIYNEGNQMSNIKIYHNPRCSKSRNALALLEEQGVDAEVIKYLDTPPSRAELTAILDMLGLSAKGLMRNKEDLYKELGINEIDDEDVLIGLMVANPKLIERPIVIKDGKAAIGRPIENIVALLK